VSFPLLLWMSPVIVGLVLAIPLGLLTSRRSVGARLFATSEDDNPPQVVLRANELAAFSRIEFTGALQQLRQDAGLLKCHLDSIPLEGRRKFGRVDVALATARAKIDQCESFDEVASWLDKSEIRAVLNNAAALQRVVDLHCAGS
jgi:membrane glycosyltransferase